MKLKVVSDGTCGGTKVVNAETGEELENVVAVMWEANTARGLNSVAQISLMRMSVECVGEAA